MRPDRIGRIRSRHRRRRLKIQPARPNRSGATESAHPAPSLFPTAAARKVPRTARRHNRRFPRRHRIDRPTPYEAVRPRSSPMPGCGQPLLRRPDHMSAAPPYVSARLTGYGSCSGKAGVRQRRRPSGETTCPCAFGIHAAAAPYEARNTDRRGSEETDRPSGDGGRAYRHRTERRFRTEPAAAAPRQRAVPETHASLPKHRPA